MSSLSERRIRLAWGITWSCSLPAVERCTIPPLDGLFRGGARGETGTDVENRMMRPVLGYGGAISPIIASRCPQAASVEERDTHWA